MRIGVLGNCQATLIARWLREMLPGDMIVEHSLGMDAAEWPGAADDLAACDAVISQFVGEGAGPIANDALRARVARFVMIPNFTFTGFQPDMVYLSHLDGATAGSPVGVYHSRIALAGYLAGLDATRVKALFNAYIYDLFGYFDEFAKARAYFDDSAAAYGYSVRTDELMAEGPFMHTVNHANVRVGRLMSRDAARLVGAEPREDVAEIEDELRRDTIWPTYPEIAARIGVPGGDTGFVRPQHWPHRPSEISLDTMIEESLFTYAGLHATLNFAPYEGDAATLRAALRSAYA